MLQSTIEFDEKNIGPGIQEIRKRYLKYENLYSFIHLHFPILMWIIISIIAVTQFCLTDVFTFWMSIIFVYLNLFRITLEANSRFSLGILIFYIYKSYLFICILVWTILKIPTIQSSFSKDFVNIFNNIPIVNKMVILIIVHLLHNLYKSNDYRQNFQWFLEKNSIKVIIFFYISLNRTKGKTV